MNFSKSSCVTFIYLGLNTLMQNIKRKTNEINFIGSLSTESNFNTAELRTYFGPQSNFGSVHPRKITQATYSA